jgi:hypothetical protein
MVGGMLTSTVLTLAVIPAVYSIWRERQLERVRRATRQMRSEVARPAHRLTA